jgi:hypothetical protein
MSVDVNIVDFISFDLYAVYPAAPLAVPIVQLVDDHYAYINRISGYNGSANSYNAVFGYIDSGGVYTPMAITACAQNAAFNTQIDKYIKPQLGAYAQITASSYPVTAQIMVDGYLFDLC